MDDKLLEILACPQCGSSVTYHQKKEVLQCRSCELTFLIEDGIAVMLLDEKNENHQSS